MTRKLTNKTVPKRKLRYLDIDNRVNMELEKQQISSSLRVHYILPFMPKINVTNISLMAEHVDIRPQRNETC